ncbi:MAG: RDD family protein [Syntrophales bacterium]|nr:RDD family protein [Syntrophales bacterium]
MIVHYGGFWRRAAAISIDTIILDLFTVLLAMIGNLLIPVGDSFSYTVIIPYYGMAVLINAAYFTYFHGTTGQTPGKRLLGLKVVQADGEPMTPGIAFLRWVGYIISKIPLFLGFLWAAFDDRKQGWHDKIAGTRVIETHRYQEIQSQASTDAPPEADRNYAYAGEDSPYDGGADMARRKKTGPMAKTLDKETGIG